MFVVKKQLGVSSRLAIVEGVLHQDEHVHIIRVQLFCNKRTKNYESCQMAGSNGDTVDSFQPITNRDSLSRATAEPVNNLTQRCWVNGKR